MIGGIVAIAYGIFVGIGGAIGYAQAKSKASLISGSISSVLLLVAGVMQLQGSNIGLFIALVVTALLVVVFAIRLVKTRKFMPAGLLTIAGVVTLAILLVSTLG